MNLTTAHRITINAPIQKVYSSISTEDGLKGWYSPSVEGKTGHGGEITLSFTENDGPFQWKITEAQPGTLVRWDCLAGPGGAKGTSATFRLTEKGSDNTVIELDHEGFKESDDKIRTCNTLWGMLLYHLKKYVETGKPEPALR